MPLLVHGTDRIESWSQYPNIVNQKPKKKDKNKGGGYGIRTYQCELESPMYREILQDNSKGWVWVPDTVERKMKRVEIHSELYNIYLKGLK